MLQHFNPRDQFKFLWAAIVLLCTFTTVMYSGKGVRTISSENTVTTIDVVTTDTACAEHKHNALTDTEKYMQLVTQSTSARVCPCCGWEGALYGNFGLTHLDDRQCPRCQALERHRTMCAMAARRKDLFQPKTSKISRVLYFGGYHNSSSKAVADIPNVDLIAVDKFIAGGEVLYVDLDDLRIPNGFAHGLIILHVLEHIANQERALTNLYNVLHPRGWLYYEVPCALGLEKHKDCTHAKSDQERHNCSGQRDHMYLLSCSQFEQQMANAGFRCESLTESLDLTDDERTKIVPLGYEFFKPYRFMPMLCFK